MSRVYLSGAMRGYPDSNLAEFRRIGQILHQHGYIVLNPSDTRHPSGSARELYLREDIQLLLVADGLIVHGDWASSPGACLEVAIAWSLGLPTHFFEEYRGDFHLLKLNETHIRVPRESNKYDLVGLCGFAQSGKDTFADVLVKDGWKRVAFADRLKDVARDIGWNGLKDDTGRKLLQDLGVAVRDHVDPGSWVDAAESDIDGVNLPVVVTDVRFPNEVRMVKRRGGHLVWIERPGVGAVNAHISEHAITKEDCESVFVNDGPLDEVAGRVHDFLAPIVKG